MSDVLVGRGLLAAPSWAKSLGDRLVLVTDKTVFQAHGRKLVRGLRRSGRSVTVHLLPSGERAKQHGALLRIYRTLTKAGLGREGSIIALGGGAVTDVAGFAAATYLRGVRWMSVPTTLLGQVDSGLGGKTGVNLPEGKNLVGAFHAPLRVICDVDALVTLPSRELLSGLGEVLKYGLSLDAALWKKLLRDAPRAIAGDAVVLESIVRRCAELKSSVVKRDPLETTGTRALLNFGHTFAHAFETASGYELRHGEAVIHGMRAALRLSVKHAGLSMRDADAADEVLAGLPVPALPRATPSRLLALMRRDKKAKAGRVRLVLISRIGKAALVDNVPERDILEVLRWL